MSILQDHLLLVAEVTNEFLHSKFVLWFDKFDPKISLQPLDPSSPQIDPLTLYILISGADKRPLSPVWNTL